MWRRRRSSPWVEWLRHVVVVLAAASAVAQELGNSGGGDGQQSGVARPQRTNALSLFVYLATSLTAILSSVNILLGLSVACQWPEPQCWCYNRLGSDKIGGRCCSVYHTNIALAPVWLGLGVLVALQREAVRAAMCGGYLAAHVGVVAYLRFKFQRMGFPVTYDDSGATVVPLGAGESELPLAFVSGGPMHLAAAAAAADGRPPPGAAWPRTQGGGGGRAGHGPPAMVLGTPVYDLPLRYAVVGPDCGPGCDCHRCEAVRRRRREQQAAEEAEEARRRAARSCEAEAGAGVGAGSPGGAGGAGAHGLWALREEDEVPSGGSAVVPLPASMTMSRRSISLPLSEPLERGDEEEQQHRQQQAGAAVAGDPLATGAAVAAAGDRAAGAPGLRRRSSGSLRAAEQQQLQQPQQQLLQLQTLQQLQRQLSPRTLSEYTFADAATAGGGFGGRTWTGNVVPAAAAAAPSGRAAALTSTEVLRRGGRPPVMGVPVPRALLLVDGVPLEDLQQQRRQSMRRSASSRPGSAAPGVGTSGGGGGGAGAAGAGAALQ
ncbi:hypothetical protein HXX76_015484 [Chlamydomonas incerta]|uniref:Uncharacterized protein n=1 Tax=Chlamydomonas incerta TaxID=51695 RepID=A0A835SEF7_CHLIN|nr:hypothetical protein HXX76_015484 [Chlamydomonas incerta]|eukprot:KAG2423227.1 hypothetical protein HXX76_015484 [Chlamydomonas incerta]